MKKKMYKFIEVINKLIIGYKYNHSCIISDIYLKIIDNYLTLVDNE